MNYWNVSKTWANETVVLVGGGPSARDVDLSVVRGKARVIAVNNAWELAPWCDVLFFADSRWWRWYGEKIPLDFSGRIITVAKGHPGCPRFLRMRRDYAEVMEHKQVPKLARSTNALWGNDSGMMAINLAFHFGASRLILIGYDMDFKAGQSHWFGDHPTPSHLEHYVNQFAPTYQPIVREMGTLGIEVLRATPSRLDFIPQMPLMDALALPPAFRSDAFT